MRYILPALVLAFLAAACSDSNSTSTSTTAPSPTPPAPAPAGVPPIVNAYALSGHVTSEATGSSISGASVSVVDGPNAGRTTTTDSNGNYTMPNLMSSSFTLSVSALAYIAATRPVSLSANATADVALLPVNQYQMNAVTGSAANPPR